MSEKLEIFLINQKAYHYAFDTFVCIILLPPHRCIYYNRRKSEWANRTTEAVTKGGLTYERNDCILRA